MQNVIYVPGYGNGTRGLVFVGEAPGAAEEDAKRPFVGASGVLLKACLHDLGIEDHQVYLTNVVKVRPEGNRIPTVAEIASWNPLLHRELADLSAGLQRSLTIVCLGKTATRALLPTPDIFSLTSYRNHVYFKDEWDARIYVTYHPAYVLRTPGLKDEFLADLERAISGK